jgi:hypothetical protein
MKMKYIKPQTEMLYAESQALMANTGHDYFMPDAKEQVVVDDDFFSEKEKDPLGELGFSSIWDDEKE